jgi:hypothetical protein
MIIRLVAASHSLEIDDPKNFKAFSLRVEGLFDAVAQAGAARPHRGQARP